jgi:hypothetical protein
MCVWDDPEVDLNMEASIAQAFICLLLDSFVLA